ncbi:MAG: type II secretion system protein [Phycisphaerales bacterium]|nr:type II secretion system protein [Phycisphaerales bacterium]
MTREPPTHPGSASTAFPPRAVSVEGPARQCDADARAAHSGARPGQAGFSLVELLIVVGIVGLLASILLPPLGQARERARAAVCGSNARQLVVANLQYAGENGGLLVAGAPRMRTENLRRWHGVRDSVAQAFVPQRGPLATYLGSDGAVRYCPSFIAASYAGGAAAFERGCGGYGYNQAYLGRVMDRATPQSNFRVVSDLVGVSLERVRRPAETLMFADTALAATAGGVIEYSFAEPRFHPEYLRQRARPDPSLHFRHALAATAAWSDGHVSPQRRTLTWQSGLYEGDASAAGLGWFGASDDNGLFDLD